MSARRLELTDPESAIAAAPVAGAVGAPVDLTALK